MRQERQPLPRLEAKVAADAAAVVGAAAVVAAEAAVVAVAAAVVSVYEAARMPAGRNRTSAAGRPS